MKNEYNDIDTQIAQAAHSVAAYTTSGANKVFELLVQKADQTDPDDPEDES